MTTTVPALSSRDRATQLLAIAVLEDRIKTVKARLRQEFAAELVVGERIPGMTDPDDPEGTALGFVQKRKGSTSAKVTDPAALLAWAKEHAPGEVVTTEAVRPSFIAAVLGAVKKDGGWLDTGTGEVLDVDGVEVSAGSPTLAVSTNDEADRLVTEALAGHRLTLPALTEGTPQ